MKNLLNKNIKNYYTLSFIKKICKMNEINMWSGVYIVYNFKVYNKLKVNHLEI